MDARDANRQRPGRERPLARHHVPSHVGGVDLRSKDQEDDDDDDDDATDDDDDDKAGPWSIHTLRIRST